MKQATIFLILHFTLSFSTQAQTFNWAKGFGGTGAEHAHSVVSDKYGNTYNVGRFHWTVDFDPGPGIYNMTGGWWPDCYIQKLDPSGNFLWAKQIGGIGLDEAFSIAIDSSNNIYIAGTFEDTVDFDPGPNVHNLTSYGKDHFILKLDSNGDFQWVVNPAVQGSGIVYDVVVDKNQNVLASGFFYGSVDFDHGPGTHIVTAQGGNRDFFVLKLNSAGNFKSVITFKSKNENGHFITDIAVDQNGNIFHCGNFSENLDFDPSISSSFVVANDSVDGYVSKLDSNGNFIWFYHLSSSEYEDFRSIKCDQFGNVYGTGMFSKGLDFDPTINSSILSPIGFWDVFIVKLSGQGNFIWAEKIGGNDQYGDFAHAIDVDTHGSVYITGDFEDLVDFDPGSGVHQLSANGGRSAFLLVLDSNGMFEWAVHGNGAVGSSGGLDVNVDLNGIVTWAGTFWNTTSLDFSQNQYIYTNGGYDSFIAKYTQESFGLTESSVECAFRVFPNPARSLLNMRWSIGVNNSVNWKIADSSGKIVLNGTSLQSETIINISSLNNGIYLLMLDGSETTRFIKND